MLPTVKFRKMKIEVNENREIILKEVYTGVGLESNDKEFFGICMRDSGFEFTYEGQNYSAQKGVIKKLGTDKPISDNNDTCCNGG